MGLIKCPECGNDVSTNATTCPHCGNPLKNSNNTIVPKYINKTERVTCWGLGGSDAIIEKLQDDLNEGWEIVSTVEDNWRGGMLRHVYTVVMKKRVN